ncbi:MAG: DUF1080 domain-containing protein [Bacteroidota bacterium]
MNMLSRYFVILLVVLLTMCQQPATPPPATPDPVEINDFLGHWSLDIEGDNAVGWLGVTNNDFLDADFLWRGGSVVPVANVYIQGDRLVATRVGNRVKSRDADGEPVRIHQVTSSLEVYKKSADEVYGYYLVPNNDGLGVDTTTFVGIRLPKITTTPDLSKIKYGEPIQLFNGKDLTGWRLLNEKQTNGFSVEDGTLVNNPVQPENGEHIRYGNIRTDQEFEDFNLKLEVNIPKGNNSGVYLRGIYEIQVFDSYGEPLDSHNMGALYSRITPSTNAEKPADTWQTLDITLVDRHITVILNGTTIIDNQPALGPTGGAISHDVFAPGPIYLQGDHGKVAYRNIVLTPIIK